MYSIRLTALSKTMFYQDTIEGTNKGSLTNSRFCIELFLTDTPQSNQSLMSQMCIFYHYVIPSPNNVLAPHVTKPHIDVLIIVCGRQINE